jgi:hypothetical protein
VRCFSNSCILNSWHHYHRIVPQKHQIEAYSLLANTCAVWCSIHGSLLNSANITSSKKYSENLRFTVAVVENRWFHVWWHFMSCLDIIGCHHYILLRAVDLELQTLAVIGPPNLRIHYCMVCWQWHITEPTQIRWEQHYHWTDRARRSHWCKSVLMFRKTNPLGQACSIGLELVRCFSNSCILGSWQHYRIIVPREHPIVAYSHVTVSKWTTEQVPYLIRMIGILDVDSVL